MKLLTNCLIELHRAIPSRFPKTLSGVIGSLLNGKLSDGSRVTDGIPRRLERECVSAKLLAIEKYGLVTKPNQMAGLN